MSQRSLKPDVLIPDRIVIHESQCLPVIYVTWGSIVIAYAFLAEVPSRATGLRRWAPGEVIGNRKWATLSGAGRAEILLRMDRMELGDVGF